MTRPRTLVLLAIATLVSAACATGAGPGGSGSPSVDGRVFLSTAVAGHELVPGSRITLTFGDGRIGANAGCNSLGAAYTLGADGTLTLGDLMTTEMACSDELMAQDGWLAAFLAGAVLQVLDGTTITLAKDGVTVTLIDRRSTNLPLEGTVWTVDGLLTGETAASIPAGLVATLVFRDGRVEVDTGCNTGSGEVTVAAGTLAFGPIGLTKKGCAADAMALEAAVVAALTGTPTYAIEGSSLTIGVGAAHGLMLRGGR